MLFGDIRSGTVARLAGKYKIFMIRLLINDMMGYIRVSLYQFVILYHFAELDFFSGVLF